MNARSEIEIFFSIFTIVVGIFINAFIIGSVGDAACYCCLRLAFVHEPCGAMDIGRSPPRFLGIRATTGLL